MTKTINFTNDFSKFRTELYINYGKGEDGGKELVEKVLNIYKPEYRNKELFNILKAQYEKTYNGFIIYGKPKYLRDSLKEIAFRAAVVYMGIALKYIQ